MGSWKEELLTKTRRFSNAARQHFFLKFLLLLCLVVFSYSILSLPHMGVNANRFYVSEFSLGIIGGQSGSLVQSFTWLNLSKLVATNSAAYIIHMLDQKAPSDPSSTINTTTTILTSTTIVSTSTTVQTTTNTSIQTTTSTATHTTTATSTSRTTSTSTSLVQDTSTKTVFSTSTRSTTQTETQSLTTTAISTLSSTDYVTSIVSTTTSTTAQNNIAFTSSPSANLTNSTISTSESGNQVEKELANLNLASITAAIVAGAGGTIFLLRRKF
jgi:hypothetical protein